MRWQGTLAAAAAVVGMMFGVSTGASADPGSGKGHAAQDAVVHDKAKQERLTKRTKELTAESSALAAAAAVGTPDQIGQWSAVQNWPVIGIHVALMPNGKILIFDSVGDKATESYAVHNFTRATLYDPKTGGHVRIDVNTGFNIFCAGYAHLPGGKLFLAGGNKDNHLNGIVQTHIFDQSGVWSRGPDMQAERWYPSVTALPNGEFLITGGDNGDTRAHIPEVRTTSGGLRALTGAGLDLPFYPWMNVAPDGTVLYIGPSNHLRKLNTTGAGAWTSLGGRDGVNRDYGSRAQYAIGKVLVAGGGVPPTSTARVVDLAKLAAGQTGAVTATGSMAFPRRQVHLTTLADGSVLATGGLKTSKYLVDLSADGPVYPAERWDPATGAWTTLAPMAVTRQYHSTALLLPDGRVLSAGGGACGDCDAVGYLAKNAEIFSPPYLFKKDGSGQLAPRPSISGAPSYVGWGSSFSVSTAQAASIRKVGLVRLGSVTHSTEFEQSYIPLSFTAGSGSLSVKAPANANIAAAGPYMLFITDDHGVPSVAHMVTVGAPASNVAPSVSLTSPVNGATYVAPASFKVAANASDSDGTVTKVEFFQGTTKIGEDLAAPYELSRTGVAAGTYTFTARAWDNAGASKTSAAHSITVNPGSNVAPSVSLTSPANGTTFRKHQLITLAASATDSDGRVVKVEFFRSDGGTKLGEDTSSPYSITWRTTKGTHYLRAKATDDKGATRLSSRVTIYVK